MFPRRPIAHAVILAYLILTFSALCLTLIRLWMPLIPRPVLLYSYGMMAPYQGDDWWNVDIEAEGQLPSGAWQRIDLAPYFPEEPGVADVVKQLRTFAALGMEPLKAKYHDLALQLLAHEREHGHAYAAIRLFFVRWPRSPGGREFLRQPIFTQREFVTQVP